MKIGYFSDLHTEFMKSDASVEKLRQKSNRSKEEVGIETFSKQLAEAYRHCDVIVAAGDIGVAGKGAEFLVETFKDISATVIFIPGNHDHWGAEYYSNIRKMRDTCEGTNVHFFYDGGTIEIDGVVFCASTLWTDFALTNEQEYNLKNGCYIMNDYPEISIKDRRAYKVRDAMFNAQDTMNDYRKIKLRRNGVKMFDAPRDALGQLKLEIPRRLIPQDVLGFHKVALANMERAAIEAYAAYKKFVLVSHHALSLRSLMVGVEGIYTPTKSDPFYASNLDVLFAVEWAPILHIHGHTHFATCYEADSTVVLSNPKGYGNGEDTGFEMGKYAEI